MPALTPRQQQILNFIQARQASFGVAPSLREIAKEFGFRSMTAAADHVRALRRKGALVHHPRLARAHTIAPGFSSAPSATSAIPLLTAPATNAAPEAPGGPAAQPAAPNCDRYLQFSPETFGLPASPALCALEIRGDAMAGRNLLDGDLALIDGARTPAPGDVVAAELNGAYGLRTIVVADDEICLRTEVPGAPELVPAAGIAIKGVVVGLVRRLVTSPTPTSTGIDLRRQP